MKLYDYLHLLSENDYRGQHTAPDRESGAPLYNLTLNGIYPNDIYSFKAKDYYSTGSSYDGLTIDIIQSYKDKKKKSITIYRAIPDLNKDINKKIKDILYFFSYKDRYKFFPMSIDKGRIIHPILYSIENKYPYEDYDYEERKKLIIQDLENELTTLRSQLKKPLKINKGDWVSITKQYAKDHGESALDNYKIITKTVSSQHIFTNGDSIHEWGYDP
jgi:hypothetical protein